MPTIRLSLQAKQLDAFKHIDQGKSQYLFYGGAKGGGKSYLVRAKEVARRMMYPGTTGVIIRKTFPELLANHIRKFFVEHPYIKQWYKAGEKAIYYPNGSVTDFKYLAATNDVYTYQGIEYDDITLDEATQHEEEVFKILKTSLRSDPSVIKRNPDFKPSFLLTGNPGGIGHGWVKRIFVDRDFNPEETPADYDFIHAKIYDNPIFIKANPQYLKNLEDLPIDLRRAYLDGDWDIFIGQFFTDFRRDIHGIEPFTISDSWGKVIAIDWGYSPHPFHVGWYAMDFQGNIFKYRELEGLETPPDELAKKVLDSSKHDQNIQVCVGDTQMWELNPFSKMPKGEAYSDKSIAAIINSIFTPEKLTMLQANKARITGWTNIKTLMKWKGELQSDGHRKLIEEPKYRIFNTCKTTLATYPNMIHSELKPEDMQKMDGDDPCDTDRYGLMVIKEGIMPKAPKTYTQRLREQALQEQSEVNEFSC